MKLCSSNHVEICFAGEGCPLCLEMAARVRAERECGAIGKAWSVEREARGKGPEVLSTQGICDLLGCSRRSVQRYREFGWLPRKALTPKGEVLGALSRINEYRKAAGPLMKAA